MRCEVEVPEAEDLDYSIRSNNDINYALNHAFAGKAEVL